jgi:hypothetical protein
MQEHDKGSVHKAILQTELDKELPSPAKKSLRTSTTQHFSMKFKGTVSPDIKRNFWASDIFNQYWLNDRL